MVSNIHMHTHFCDGGDQPEKYVVTAIKKGLPSVGFSAHAPVPFDCNWAVPSHKLKEYIQAVLYVKEEYKSKIQIYLGLELDYFPDLVNYSKDLLQSGPFDYFIASVHFIDSYPDGRRWTIDGPHEEFRKGFSEIFQNNSLEVTRKFFDYTRRMISELKPPVIGHIDKLKMQHRPDCFIPEDNPFFREELLKTLEAAKQSGSIVEINTRALYKKRGDTFYPGQRVFSEMYKMGIKVMVNSDAHLPEEITNEFGYAFSELRKAGYKEHHILIDNQFKAVEIPEQV